MIATSQVTLLAASMGKTMPTANDATNSTRATRNFTMPLMCSLAVMMPSATAATMNTMLMLAVALLA